MKRVLYVATRNPLPIIGGGERMICQSLKMLQDRYEVGLVYFARKNTPIAELNKQLVGKFCLNYIRTLTFPRKIELLRNITRLKRRSLQELLFYSKSASNIIDQAVIEFKPDFIVIDMLRIAQYVENSSLPKMLELQDLLSVRYKRFCDNTTSEDNLLGTFGELLPKFVSNILNRYCKIPLLKYEAKQIRLRETELINKFDAITLVSHNEVARLKGATGVSHIYAIPPTVEKLMPKDAYNDASICNIVFLGNVTTNQNLSSFRYIVENVLPLLDAKQFDYTFTVVGNYDQRANEIANINHKIILSGYVDSLSEVISTKHLMLSPITFGSGIKTKILDAMSFGLPIITNAIGAEGLTVENRVHLIIEEDPNLMALAVELLFNDRDLRMRIAAAAIELIRSDYDDNLIKIRYINIIENIISRQNTEL